jgi:hypothetical protein
VGINSHYPAKDHVHIGQGLYDVGPTRGDAKKIQRVKSMACFWEEEMVSVGRSENMLPTMEVGWLSKFPSAGMV